MAYNSTDNYTSSSLVIGKEDVPVSSTKTVYMFNNDDMLIFSIMFMVAGIIAMMFLFLCYYVMKRRIKYVAEIVAAYASK